MVNFWKNAVWLAYYTQVHIYYTYAFTYLRVRANGTYFGDFERFDSMSVTTLWRRCPVELCSTAVVIVGDYFSFYLFYEKKRNPTSSRKTGLRVSMVRNNFYATAAVSLVDSHVGPLKGHRSCSWNKFLEQKSGTGNRLMPLPLSSHRAQPVMLCFHFLINPIIVWVSVDDVK